eukprot:GGOE01036742.1.p1 GENE.GGOE01036742.1~~GGOE01036742.1.p1  ORF type:complete len:323 (+),score=45.82 GGOE01036742.1:53-1021(+)
MFNEDPATCALSICISKTHLNGELAAQLSLSFLAHRAIVFQCSYVARTVHSMKVLAEHSGKDPGRAAWAACPIKITVIGCGNVGGGIVEDLLSSGLYHKTWLNVSTRQPNNLSRFQAAGVHCCFDNAYVCNQAELIFLCCPPAQLHTVVTEIKGHLSPGCIVFSTVAGIAAHTLIGLLGHPYCFTTYLKPHLIAEHFACPTAQLPALDAQKYRDLLILTNPFHTTSDFFERLLFCLADSWHHRQLSFPYTLKLALYATFGEAFAMPTEVIDTGVAESSSSRNARNQMFCTYDFVAKIILGKEMPELLQLLRQKYMMDLFPTA